MVSVVNSVDTDGRSFSRKPRIVRHLLDRDANSEDQEVFGVATSGVDLDRVCGTRGSFA
jgi:hypothetical protein